MPSEPAMADHQTKSRTAEAQCYRVVPVNPGWVQWREEALHRQSRELGQGYRQGNQVSGWLRAERHDHKVDPELCCGYIAQCRIKTPARNSEL